MPDIMAELLLLISALSMGETQDPLCRVVVALLQIGSQKLLQQVGAF